VGTKVIGEVKKKMKAVERVCDSVNEKEKKEQKIIKKVIPE